jgi:hypothetical protein
MALTTNHPNNELIKFRRNVATDFLRASRFDPFMGNDSTNPIVRMSDLAGDGKEIRIPLVTQLIGSGVGVWHPGRRRRAAGQLRYADVGRLGS